MLSKKLIKHIIFSGLLEFGPVLLFLFSYGHMSLYESTGVLMIATIVSTVATYHIQKRIPYLALYVAILTTIFGFMTLHFRAMKFIQMRDTLYDITCALTLLIGMATNTKVLKLAFHKILPMEDEGWERLTHLWVLFFIILASSNEIVRRLFTLHDWFVFKAWAVFATSMFGLISVYLSYKPKQH